MADPINITNAAVDLSGKTLLTAENPETISGEKTFARAPLRPFATQAGSAMVPNFDADLLDGQHGDYYRNASNMNAGTVPSAHLPDLLPAGIVLSTAAAIAPPGWLLCDGSAVSRTTYAALFTALGITFGAGDSSTTFNVPDLRGRAVIGVGTGAGLTARALAAATGAETHVHTGPSHTHGGGTLGAPASALTQTIQNGTGANFALAHINHTHASFTGATAAGGTENTGNATTMQPSLALNYIIKT